MMFYKIDISQIELFDELNNFWHLTKKKFSDILFGLKHALTFEALTIFVKTMETKGFFSIWNHHKCLSSTRLI